MNIMAEFDYIYNNLTADEKMLSDKLGYMDQYKLQNKIGGLFNQPNRSPPLNRNQKIADVLQEKDALRHGIMTEIQAEAEKRKVADLLDYAREYMTSKPRSGMQNDQPEDLDRRTLFIIIVVLVCVTIAQYFHCQQLVTLMQMQRAPGSTVPISSPQT
jgi:hypothetical protein